MDEYFLESLRKQLGDVDIARKAAADQAEENKNLARDIQDVYEEKMAKLGFQIDWLKGLIWLAESINQSETIWNLYKLAKKCEQWRLEADKQNENAKRYREERNKCKFFVIIQMWSFFVIIRSWSIW